MLDLSLENVSFEHHGSNFRLADVSFRAAKGTHTLIAGAGGSGKSTLLRLITGDHRPTSGTIHFGARDATSLSRRKRPVLFVSPALDVPGRWSVQHLLIASLSRRSLDREDRMTEFRRIVGNWALEGVLGRRLDSLSSHEVLVARLAAVEALRPAVGVFERIFDAAAAPQRAILADRFFRVLRGLGTTVVTEASSQFETAFCDRVVILDSGAVVQEGTPYGVYRQPVSVTSARALGSVNALPAIVRNGSVETRAGVWELAGIPWDGEGYVLVRPEDFAVAASGEESDFIFGVEEARFSEGAWTLLGFLPGGQVLQVRLQAAMAPRKGQLVALRIDPQRIVVVRGSHRISDDTLSALPSRSESR